jgi:hypothetical protein
MAIVVLAMVSLPLAKVFRRKTLLCVSAMGVSVCLFLLGTFYYLKSFDLSKQLHWLPLVGFLAYIAFFMLRSHAYL